MFATYSAVKRLVLIRL